MSSSSSSSGTTTSPQLPHPQQQQQQHVPLLQKISQFSVTSVQPALTLDDIRSCFVYTENPRYSLQEERKRFNGSIDLASEGLATGWNALGSRFAEGICLHQSFPRALECYRRSAMLDDPDGLYHFGMYLCGSGAGTQAVDLNTAVTNTPLAMEALERCIERVPQVMERAVQVAKRQVELEDADLYFEAEEVKDVYERAQLLLGQLLTDAPYCIGQQEEELQVVVETEEEAMEKAQRDGERGIMHLTRLANNHLADPEHRSEAAMCLVGTLQEMAEEQGNDWRENVREDLYEKNVKDPLFQRLFHSLKLAATLGIEYMDPEECTFMHLGELYLNGVGTKVNPDMAETWLKRAVQYGMQDAQDLLKSVPAVRRMIQENEEKWKNIAVYTCAQCRKPDGDNIKLKKCSRCKMEKYCSIACQRKHWPKHKLECKKADTEAVPSGATTST